MPKKPATRNTVPRATYLSVLMIGVFFVFTTWMMVAGVGADKLVETVGVLGDPTSYFFMLADQYVGGVVTTIAGLLLVSSLFAALSALQNYIARYTYVAGREGLLPAALGPVEVHRELMMAAVRWIIAVKLVSVLQALMAMRLNSLILQKKFSIR